MNLKSRLPYLAAILIFIVASLLYFNPVLSGKTIKQSDITQFIGMSKEVSDYRATHNEEPYWLNNAFSGMPAYQVSAYYPNDFVRYLDKVLRFLPRPADYLFLYFLGFFFLLTALKTDWKLAILGSLSFGFSTYLIIIFGAGHNAKAHAIAYMPFVLAGIIYIFQKKYWLGFLVTAIAMALEIYANHPQMTYYLGFCLLILGVVKFVEALQQKNVPDFGKQVAIIVLATVLGLGVNSSRLLAMKEYASYSTRGKSELTINPDGSSKESSSGLDKAYITEYSYGIAETFNLIIPRFTGGGTFEELSENSNFYKTLAQRAGRAVAEENSRQVLAYWGNQPIVEAPAYIGAVIFFLFFLGAFLVQDKLKYWLIGATIFSIVLSWGKNFSVVTNFFIDFVPLYNKFRAVSSIQVIAELCVPILGILGLRDFFSSDVAAESKEKALKNAFYVLGGITLFFAFFGTSLFAFEGIRDGNYQELPELIEALISDRKQMMFYDSIRSFILLLVSAALLWFLLKGKLKQVPVILGLGFLILFDLVTINMKYVNAEDFENKRRVLKPFTASEADKMILEDEGYYRVMNFTVNPMKDGRTSYFHNSVGGYHAAKMKKYNELFEYQINTEPLNFEVLNMLNTKYMIISNTEAQVNPEINGNAWFVNSVKIVDTADEEMQLLSTLKTKSEAVVSKKNLDKISISNTYAKDTTATIQLTKYGVKELQYESNANTNQFAVFSEIYYKDGWRSFIDGKEVPHFNVNYVLRGMEIPSGKHRITFTFEPKVVQRGKIIGLVCYVLLFLIPLGWFFVVRKNNTNL